MTCLPTQERSRDRSSFIADRLKRKNWCAMVEIALCAQVLVWLIVIGVFLAGGEASLFHPVTWYLIFHGVVFVLRPILVQGFGFDFLWRYMGFHPTDEVFVLTLIVSSVGLI